MHTKAKSRCLLLIPLVCTLCGLATLPGCGKSPNDRIQGYIEGEFLYASSPLGGKLEELHVQRGSNVVAGDVLFELDSTPEQAARDEAKRRLLQAQAALNDARKGKRPSEIEAIRARLKEAEAALRYSEMEAARQEKLLGASGAATEQEVDRARAVRDQDRQRVAQLAAELETAQLGDRPDQVIGAEANVRALEAALSKAEWELTQTRQLAPEPGRVFDTLYQEGEWVVGGRPVVVLLPPGKVKLRFFVPEERLGSMRIGHKLNVFIDGLGAPVAATVSFISPQAEYTPPMIYSRENRRKFVFLVEGTFEPAVAGGLHPGQPVEVQLDRAP